MFALGFLRNRITVVLHWYKLHGCQANGGHCAFSGATTWQNFNDVLNIVNLEWKFSELEVVETKVALQTLWQSFCYFHERYVGLFAFKVSGN